jgi:hypothetical protein
MPPGGVFDPLLQVFLGHLGVIGNQASKIHRIGDTAIVKIERELIVRFDALLNLLHVLDLDAQARLLRAVLQPHLPGLLSAELLELGDDFFGGHLLSPSPGRQHAIDSRHFIARCLR